MLAQEKTYRLVPDFVATPRFCVAILDVLFKAGDWDGINDHIVLLSKRRAQLKQAVGAMVKEAMTFVDKAPNLEVKTKLIETLNDVTAGKIFVEVEKARLTRALAKIKEEAGLTNEAAEIMQEVAVETYGALSKHEKLFFIEEQVRLCLDKGDTVRAQILSRKINPRSFDEIEKKKNASVEHAEGYFEATDPTIPSVPELKLRYYQLMIRFHSHSDDYLEVCRCYQNVMECDGIKDDAAKCTAALKKVVWYVTLAANEPMQQSLLHSISKDTRLIDLPLHKQLTKQFTTKEIIHWDVLSGAFAAEMAHETDIFGDSKRGEKRRADLRQRVIEHNLLVIGAYYSRVTMTRLGELLCLPPDETEKHLSDLVVAKKVSAKIDRPGGVVDFKTKAQGADWLLNQWVGKIDKLLSTLDKANHLIHKEAMARKVSLE
ncbi:uncharacterized protein MICPUCDRAFT_34916 [Micromonas pusilla CCMP1545]|uniref:Predicted protein n=1 Tax=Micromonas pusilla (strain CCMP1545) TaxID=564608 RepID=C1MZA5_MICPC|nr:uncharacterized protein MICPUCDRAFT_34916 [Micromonas pusilla CCMP1545]EEH54574.1 predicted protein [Micromonas pusilla CCMP1545]|eukprot:XP_003060924.1 predicted protein [Micromonas pusilla CCMP1545]